MRHWGLREGGMHEGGKGRKIRKEKKRKMVVPMFWRGE
jgi:hypothetical protein